MLDGMRRNAGFTLIELLITITILVVLVTLTVVNLRSNEIKARDDQRKTDVTSIAQQLENFYRSGSDDPNSFLSHTDQYPPTVLMDSESDIKATLQEVDTRTLRAPGVADTDPISLTIATDGSQPTPDLNVYVYQPLKSDGTICQSLTDECRKFNLYYLQESDSTVQKVTSKHQ